MMDIETALDRYLFSASIATIEDLDQAFIDLTDAVNAKQHELGDIITTLLQQESYIFEAFLVSRGAETSTVSLRPAHIV